MQTDYEKRLKEVESQREQLLNEMEARENILISKVSVHMLQGKGRNLKEFRCYEVKIEESEKGQQPLGVKPTKTPLA